MRRMTILLFLCLVSSGLTASADDAIHAKRRQSPQEAAKAFLIAVSSRDEQAIRQVILPNQKAPVLWEGEAPPKEAVAKLRARFATVTWRECKPGETVDLSGSRKLTITDEMVGQGRRLLLPVVDGEPTPPPVPLVLVDGRWKVDATPIITEITKANRIRHVAQLGRACLAYAEDNQGTLPSELSKLRNVPKDIAIADYVIVAHGKPSNRSRAGTTILVREKRKDADGRYAAAYLDGHAAFANPEEDEPKPVRAVCNVCGAWTQGKSVSDPNIARFTVRHLNGCGKGKFGTIVKYVYPADRDYRALKKDDFEEQK